MEKGKRGELEPADTDAKLGLAKTLIEMNQPDKALTLLADQAKVGPTPNAPSTEDDRG